MYDKEINRENEIYMFFFSLSDVLLRLFVKIPETKVARI